MVFFSPSTSDNEIKLGKAFWLCMVIIDKKLPFVLHGDTESFMMFCQIFRIMTNLKSILLITETGGKEWKTFSKVFNVGKDDEVI